MFVTHERELLTPDIPFHSRLAGSNVEKAIVCTCPSHVSGEAVTCRIFLKRLWRSFRCLPSFILCSWKPPRSQQQSNHTNKNKATMTEEIDLGIEADIRMISGCEDHQTSADGTSERKICSFTFYARNSHSQSFAIIHNSFF